MLRRRLLARVGLLILAFVVGAVVAIGLLQRAMERMGAINDEARLLSHGLERLDVAVTSAEPSSADAPVPRDEGTAKLDRALIEFGELPAARREGAVAGAYVRMVECAKSLRQVRSPDAQSAWRALHGTQRALDAACREHIAREQASQAGAFRWLVLGLTLAALVMVNVAVLVLFRITTMIVKPVASLVEGSRELAAERFEHRVPVGLSDEFGELAHAYNRLAERLQANEARKAETLRQLAVTLNHGLNNAMGIIELQLGMVDRESVGNPVLARHLREIRAVLARMGHIVSSLKNIRRVVLTDYAPGLQMVDLERSVEVETSPETPGVQALAGDSRETHGIGGAP